MDHPTRGKYLTVGNPIKMSDSPTEVKRSPLLGEHTDEVLAELGYKTDEVQRAAVEESHLTPATCTATDLRIDDAPRQKRRTKNFGRRPRPPAARR